MRIFEKINVDFMGKRKFFYTLSSILFLIGVLSAIFRGFAFGIDFKGGTEILLQFQKPMNVGQLRSEIENIGLGNIELKSYGGTNSFIIRTELQAVPRPLFPGIIKRINSQIESHYPGLPYQIVDSTTKSVTYNFPNPDTTNALVDKLFRAGFQTSRSAADLNNTKMTVSIGISDLIKINLKEKIMDNSFTVLKEDQVGPKVGGELKRNAILAVFLSLLMILIYLAFRFKFVFAAGAVIALFHDVLITLGLYLLLFNVVPGLNLEIDLTTVAAFLTLIGFSINDTVIVFDRVREMMKIHKTMPFGEVINLAVNKTLSRTIITSGTVAFSALVLVIFGGEVIRAFSVTMLFGVIIGTYSSVFVASAIVFDYELKTNKRIEF
jgi:preprotein translocase subunit SecF